ncbi:MAG TPA: response regulator [Bryobacteraceae bacterium]|nr:response regulator [Bryobacteraceae bacterium]
MTEPNSSLTHVLIVEDNRADVRIIRMALAVERDWPLDISVAEDGEQAIAYLSGLPPYEQAEKPDLVILDMNLPKFDGTEVLRAIRATENLRSLPVIVLSSAPVSVLESKAHDAGVSARCYLTKPLEYQKWMAIGKEIRRCFNQGGDEATLSASSAI